MAAALTSASALPAQTAEKGVAKAQTSAPPVDLSGVWRRSRRAPDKTRKYTIYDLAFTITTEKPPMTPWAEEKFKANKPTGPTVTSLDSNDPDFQCFPSGVPRIYLFLYPMEIIHTPGRVLMLFEYGHNIRQIFTDGRGHAQDAEATWMGDSIGHWEGDTLVAETTGLNDKTWFGYGGQPHSDALRVVERFRRPDPNSLVIDITLDDPKAYTMPLHTQKKYVLKPDWNIMEFVCEDNLLNFRDYEKEVAIPQKAK
jgi:hypothetical protein